MNAQKVQVSPQPILKYASPEDHRELMDYFILGKTWYAIDGYVKWFGVNPWKKQIDENGKSKLQMIKPMQFWLRFVISVLIIQALQISLIVYVLIYYEVWDVILTIDGHISESKMDSATGMAGTFVVCFIYGPFVFNLRKFGEGIVQAQEHFKNYTYKANKSDRKISIYIGMYV